MGFLNKLWGGQAQPRTTLTSHLLSSAPEEYKAATQAPFLLAAAQGRLSKAVLGRWLAADRLYFHSYIRAAGTLLASLDLPQEVPNSAAAGDGDGDGGEAPEARLVDWVCEHLARVRAAERQLVTVAARYGIGLDLGRRPMGPAEPGTPSAAAEGEDGREVAGRVRPPQLLLADAHDHHNHGQQPVARAAVLLPWLEAAVMFWGTERCHFDAWSWARAHEPVDGSGDAVDDADGGALRREFIPSWSSAEFEEFVERLAGIIDGAADKAIEQGGKDVRHELLRRVEGKWRSLLVAEAAFWPEVE